MNPRVLEIASRLQQHYLGPAAASDMTIFLCGGAGRAEEAIRRKLGKALASRKSKYRYLVYYPEDMFVELILGHQKQDLLTLESLLARSVGAVVILLQSPGTFTELGAFSNHDLLKNKLVVVVDPKYRKDQSFIITGPIRYLHERTSSKVLFMHIGEPNLDALVKGVAEASRAVAAQHPPQKDLTNPIMCYDLYLSLLYVLDPVPRRAFSIVAAALEPSCPQDAQISAETVLNGLMNNGDALLISNSVSISRKGMDSLLSGTNSVRKRRILKNLLSELRVYALNGMLRRRHARFWGEAA